MEVLERWKNYFWWNTFIFLHLRIYKVFLLHSVVQRMFQIYYIAHKNKICNYIDSFGMAFWLILGKMICWKKWRQLLTFHQPWYYPKKIKIGPGWLSYIFGWQIVKGSRDFEFPRISNKYYVSVCILQNAHLFISIVH